MKKTQQEELLKKAKEMLAFSYTPYSNFKVGAALLAKSGKVFGGCSGERGFEAIAIVGGPDGQIKDFCPPCGVCRQVMMEFCEPKKFKIILQNALGKIKEFTLEELLPLGFGAVNLERQ